VSDKLTTSINRVHLRNAVLAANCSVLKMVNYGWRYIIILGKDLTFCIAFVKKHDFSTKDFHLGMSLLVGQIFFQPVFSHIIFKCAILCFVVFVKCRYIPLFSWFRCDYNTFVANTIAVDLLLSKFHRCTLRNLHRTDQLCKQVEAKSWRPQCLKKDILPLFKFGRT